MTIGKTTGLVALALAASIGSGCMSRFSAAETAHMIDRFAELDDELFSCGLTNGWYWGDPEKRRMCASAAREQHAIYMMNSDIRERFPGLVCRPEYGCGRTGRFECSPEGCINYDENGEITSRLGEWSE